MTYGELRLFFSQYAPGVSLDLIDGWVAARYTSILDRLSWSRQEGQSTFNISDPYTTGTVSVVNGSSSISGSGTTWTTAMNGWGFRLAGASNSYQFTQISATSGTLDRAYVDDTASAQQYKLNQQVYQMAADARIIQDVRLLDPAKSLKKASLLQLNERDPSRIQTGTPDYWALHIDANTDPPVMQVELWPTASASTSAAATYIYDGAAPTSSSVTLLPWVRPGALQAGVQADILGKEKDWTGMRTMEALFETRVLEMLTNECRRVGSRPIRLAPSMSRHRMKRWLR